MTKLFTPDWMQRGKLKFVVGDYADMVKDPRMVGPFVQSFAAMGRVR